MKELLINLWGFEVIRLTVVVLLAMAFVFALNTAKAKNSIEYYDAFIKVESVGNYKIQVQSFEYPKNEVLPIIGSEYFKKSQKDFIVKTGNLAPSATYEKKKNIKTKVDIIFLDGLTKDKQATISNFKNNFKKAMESYSEELDIKYQEFVGYDGIYKKEEYDKKILMGTISGHWGDDGNFLTGADYNVPLFGEGKDRWREWISFSFESVLNKIKEQGKELDQIDIETIWYKRLNTGEYKVDGDSELYYDGKLISQRKDGSRPKAIIKPEKPLYTGADITYCVEGDSGKKVPIYEIDRNIRITTEYQIKDPINGGYRLGAILYVYTKEKVLNIIDTRKNIALADALKKSDIVYRDNSKRFLVYSLQGTPMGVSRDSDKYTEAVVTLTANNMYLIGINESTIAFDNILEDIKSLEDSESGLQLSIDNLGSGPDELREFVLSKCKNTDESGDYYIVGETIEWKTKYADAEHDLPLNFGEHDGSDGIDYSDILLGNAYGVGLTHLFKGDKLIAEKWRFRHDSLYFDNGEGQIQEDGVWIANPITKFEKPGRYRVNYKRKDNPIHPNVNITDNFDEYRQWSTNYDPR